MHSVGTCVRASHAAPQLCCARDAAVRSWAWCGAMLALRLVCGAALTPLPRVVTSTPLGPLSASSSASGHSRAACAECGPSSSSSNGSSSRSRVLLAAAASHADNRMMRKCRWKKKSDHVATDKTLVPSDSDGIAGVYVCVENQRSITLHMFTLGHDMESAETPTPVAPARWSSSGLSSESARSSPPAFPT